MYAWAAEASVQYGGKPRKANGRIESMEFSSHIFILVSLIPPATINELTGLRAAVVKVNVELISRDVLLAEKEFLEKGLAEDFAQLENGKNQITRELSQGYKSNPHGLVDEVNRTIPNSIKYKQEAIKKNQ